MTSRNVEFFDAFSSDKLQLILFPTEQCNFRCSYCYEDFKLGKMLPNVVAGIKRLVESRNDLKKLSILWFGGEPTVALDVVLELQKFFQDYCAARDVRLYSHMTTNGYRIGPSVFKELVDLGISDYQITLDGKKEHHDSTRRLMNGAGTFDRINRNLKAMKDSSYDFHVALRVHVSKSNAASVSQLVTKIDEDFLSDRRFSINIHPVEPLSPHSEMNQEALDPAEIQPNLAALRSSLRNGSLSRTQYGHGSYICYAAQANSFVIRSNGRVGKCTVALHRAENDLGFISEDGKLHVASERHARWLLGWATGNDAALGCPAGSL